jgi:hypothetical protein
LVELTRPIAQKKGAKSKKEKAGKLVKKPNVEEKMNEYLDLRFLSPADNLNSMQMHYYSASQTILPNSSQNDRTGISREKKKRKDKGLKKSMNEGSNFEYEIPVFNSSKMMIVNSSG